MLSATGCVDPEESDPARAEPHPLRRQQPALVRRRRQGAVHGHPGRRAHQRQGLHARSGRCASRWPTGRDHAPEGHWSFPGGLRPDEELSFQWKLLETRLFVRISDTWDRLQLSMERPSRPTPPSSTNAGLTTNIVNGDGGTQSWYFPSAQRLLPVPQRRVRGFAGHRDPATQPHVHLPERRRGQSARHARAPRHVRRADHPAGPAGRLHGVGRSTGKNLDTKARSYLHANCAICHLPEGNYSSIDLRFGTPLADDEHLQRRSRQGRSGRHGRQAALPGTPQVGPPAAHGGARQDQRPHAAARHVRPRSQPASASSRAGSSRVTTCP